MVFYSFPSRQPGAGLSISTLTILLAIWCASSNFRYAYASTAGLTDPSDHNHPLIANPDPEPTRSSLTGEKIGKVYEPRFSGIVESIVGRQSQQSATPLVNNIPGKLTISGGDSTTWIFPKSLLKQSPTPFTVKVPPSQDQSNVPTEVAHHVELKRRQASDVQIWVTLNVCSQPSARTSNPSQPPPQLELFLPSTAAHQDPNGALLDPQVQVIGGFGEYSRNTSGDTFITVTAPTDSGFNGTYSYELTVSTDGPYTSFLDFQSLYTVDTDSSAALFVTTNLTTSNSSDVVRADWMGSGSPFRIFVHNQNDTMIAGIRRSFCGLSNYANSNTSEVGMTQTNSEVKQQFYVANLNRTSSYLAIMALQSNNTASGPGNVGGGGVVWQDIAFNTKNDGNCQIIYNLTFCDSVTYAVPSNPTLFPNMSSLAQQYDSNATNYYQKFVFSIEQVPCNTTPSAQYSLAVNCNDCRNAYKKWLCAVTIPRCVDFSSKASYLQTRNIAQNFIDGTVPSTDIDPIFTTQNQMAMSLNSSRNTNIDNVIKPGPYKELLPCQGLCYSLVQSCPAILQFSCPSAGKGLEQSYGNVGQIQGVQTCNIPGALWGVSKASRQSPGRWGLSVIVPVMVGCVFAGF